MNQKNTDHAGFTIIELLFFVVISAALIIIPIRLLSGRSRDVQFTDATRTVQAQMQRQYSNTLNGVRVSNETCSVDTSSRDLSNNPNASDYADPLSYNFGGSTNDGSCVFLGTLVEFADVANTSQGQEVRRIMTTYEVIGANLSPAELDDCLSKVSGSVQSSAKRARAAMYCMQPTFRKVEETKMLWGLEVNKVGHDFNNGLAFVRDPQTDRLFPIGLKDSFKATDYNSSNGYKRFLEDSGSLADKSSHLLTVDAEYSGYVCLVTPGGSDNEIAKIGLGSLTKQDVIELEYGKSSSCKDTL